MNKDCAGHYDRAIKAQQTIPIPEVNIGQDDDRDESDKEGKDNADFNEDEIQNLTLADATMEIPNLTQLVANLPPVVLYSFFELRVGTRYERRSGAQEILTDFTALIMSQLSALRVFVCWLK